MQTINTVEVTDRAINAVPVALCDVNGALLPTTAAGTVLNSASAAYTASGASASLAVSQYRELAVDVNVTALSGTTPTIQYFVDRLGADGNFYTVWSSASITATGTASTSIGAGCATNAAFGTAVRLRWTVGGTTPSVTFSASLVGK